MLFFIYSLSLNLIITYSTPYVKDILKNLETKYRDFLSKLFIQAHRTLDGFDDLNDDNHGK